MTISIGILIFDGVEELDFVGPWEVFTMANEVSKHSGGPDVHDVKLIAERDGPVTCAKGMRVLPDLTTAECAHLDVLRRPRRPRHAPRSLERGIARLDRDNRARVKMDDQRLHRLFASDRRRTGQGQTRHHALELCRDTARQG